MKSEQNLLDYWLGPNLPKENVAFDPSSLSRYIKQPIKRHLAHLYAPVLTSLGTEVIGITGTAGKTTLKDMLRSILSTKFKTTASRANVNPAFNIPNTILSSPPGTEKMILEMGVEYPGDMDFYLWLVKPKIGIVTSVYWAHTEFFGDIEGVFKEKSKLIQALPEDGVAILNLDDPQVMKMEKLTKRKVLTFSGQNKQADAYSSKVSISPDFKTNFTLHLGKQTHDVSLPILGEHFVPLACAAALVADNAGIKIEAIANGLEDFTPPPHRMVPFDLDQRGILIDDTYNANPLAAKAAIQLVNQLAGRRKKIMVLGEMKELGEFAEQGHKDVGKYLAEFGFEVIITLGDLPEFTIEEAVKQGIKAKNTYHAESKDEINKLLQRLMNKDTVTLIKGSRSMKMEEIVSTLITGI